MVQLASMTTVAPMITAVMTEAVLPGIRQVFMAPSFQISAALFVAGRGSAWASFPHYLGELTALYTENSPKPEKSPDHEPGK